MSGRRTSLLAVLFEIEENPAKAVDALHDPEMVKLYNRFVKTLRAMRAQRDGANHAPKPSAFRVDHTAIGPN
jgi:hypothetical protein